MTLMEEECEIVKEELCVPVTEDRGCRDITEEECTTVDVQQCWEEPKCETVQQRKCADDSNM